MLSARAFACRLLLGAALLLSGTGAATAATLRVGMQLEPPQLDPTSAAAAPINELCYGNLYEGLLRLAADGTPEPRLAESWKISADGLDYTFQLRAGVRFHDGTPFDAEIARFALERARAADSLNPQRSLLAAVASVDVLSPLRLRIHLQRRDGNLLQSLASGALVMVAPASAAGNRTHPVGTGPFRFADWRRGDSVTLQRNDDYWGGQPALERVVYRFIQDPAAAYAALMAGDLDVFPNYPAPENLAQFKADRRFVVETASTEGETVLAFNHRRPALADLRVRQAISYALDRQAIVDGAMFGYGTPIGSHFSPANRAWIDLTGVYPHRPERARELLREADADGLSLTLKLPPTAYARRSGEIVAAQLAQAGIRTRIENLEWAQWMDQVFVRHDFDLSIVVHAEPLDYTIYGRDDYYFGYRSEDYKRKLASLADTVDAQERLGILRELQQILARDAANGFLFQYPLLQVRDRRVEGLPVGSVSGSTELGGVRIVDAPRGAGDAAASGSGLTAALGGLGLFAIAAAILAAGVSAWRRFGALWLLQRLGALLATLFVASALVFVLVQVAPGDPALSIMGVHADPAAVDALRRQLGLDQSALARYGQWIGGLLHGDAGQSYIYQVPVAALIADRVQVSLPLAVLALLGSTALALPVGIAGAYYRGRWPDRALAALTQCGIALPNFWLGILLTLLFAIGLRWLPAGGFAGWEHGLGAALTSLLLPALALALPQAAILASVLRTALIETSAEDYLRTARAKGLGAFAALCRHSLPNAMIEVLTILGLQFSFLLAGAVVIENVFFLPGIGRLVLQAVAQRDLILVQNVVLLLVLIVVTVSFLVDLAYHIVDPRLGSGARR